MKKTIYLLGCILLLQTAAFSQQKLLQSGPMLGYSTMKEVAIWLQTNKTATVQIRYWNNDNPKVKHFTNIVNTK